MKKNVKFLGVFVACLFLSLSFSCQNPDALVNANEPNTATLAGQEPVTGGSTVDQTILDMGRVTWIDLEGGFYGIVGTKGNYDPVNLPKAFCADGLWVIFLALPVTNQVSVHDWGTLVSILRIETLPERIISDVGTVQQSGIQGKPWIIAGTKGTYQPINLADQYKVPGLEMKFTARVKTDIATVPALWPIIEIITIAAIPAEPVYFNVGEKFLLPVTYTAIEKNAGIKMLFEKIVSDSRCPIGAECLVAGYAQVSVRIAIGGVDYGSILLDTDMSKELRIIGGYRFSLIDLRPYPTLQSPMPPQRQVGTFLVEKVSVPATPEPSPVPTPVPTLVPTPVPTQAPTPVPQIVFTIGEAFKLPVTQTAVEQNEKIEFTFDQVVSDSRCPKDAVCIQAGDAVIAVSIVIGGVNYGSYKLSLAASPSVRAGDFRFTFTDLYPYPAVSPDVRPAGYVGYFIVEKAIPEPIYFALGQEFKLPVERTAIEQKARIELVFDEVIYDTRCVVYTTDSIDAGEAVILMSGYVNGKSIGQFKISTNPARNTVLIGMFTLRFLSLFPHPGMDLPIYPDGYIGTFIVEPAMIIIQG